MFREIKNVRQEPGAGHRRWFESDGCDLVVWFNGPDAVAGFQICYEFGGGEYALSWRERRGFAHDAVDAGDATPFKNETPILVPARDVPWRQILQAFEARGHSLERGLGEFVRQKLLEGAGRSEAKSA